MILSSPLLIPSPIQSVTYNGRQFFVKRDDLIHKHFSGNKARKFWFLFEKDLSSYSKIATFGGNQSNAMLAVAAFAKLKDLEFEYYLKPLPKFLKQSPSGNFKVATQLGMKYTETKDLTNIGRRYKGSKTLFLEQGGAQVGAEIGIKLLADEISTFANANELNDFIVYLPSGTGTTALYLNKNLDAKVITTPVAGDSEYLTKQFTELEPNSSLHPEIIDTPKKFAFGKLYPEFYTIWKDACKQTQIEFELLYDPKAFMLIDTVFKNYSQPIIYIHQGGTIGNETMQARYNRLFSKTTTNEI